MLKTNKVPISEAKAATMRNEGLRSEKSKEKNESDEIIRIGRHCGHRGITGL